MLWDQGVYHVFHSMNEDSKHIIIVKGLVDAKEHKFSKSNPKDMKVVMEQTLKEAPPMDEDVIIRRKKKRLAKGIVDEDWKNYEWAAKEDKKKQAQTGKEEEELMAKKHKT